MSNRFQKRDLRWVLLHGGKGPDLRGCRNAAFHPAVVFFSPDLSRDDDAVRVPACLAPAAW